MAKQRAAGPNKSEAIRELLAAYPDLPAKSVAVRLGVTPNLVYLVKAKLKAKVRKAKRQQLAASGSGSVDVISLLTEIKELAQKAGGIKELKKYVDVLAE